MDPADPTGAGGPAPPSAAEPRRLYAPSAGRLPPVDERIAPPETRVEYIRGVEMFAAPADEPHGGKHFDLTYLLGAHVAGGYLGAVDMLTRTGEGSDMAPDASIYPAARDPETGGRRIEELAFEVTSEQRLNVPTSKARELAARGVRRVFCLLVKEHRVLEWDRGTDGWSPLAPDGAIEDRALVRPLPVRALLHAAAADEAVVHALAARRVPALERLVAQGKAEGKVEGTAESVLAILAARGVEATGEQRARILGCRDPETLDRWLRAATHAHAADEVLADPGREA